MKNKTKENNDNLEGLGNGIVALLILGLLGAAAYWLLKFVLFAVLIWFVVFKLPGVL